MCEAVVTHIGTAKIPCHLESLGLYGNDSNSFEVVNINFGLRTGFPFHKSHSLKEMLGPAFRQGNVSSISCQEIAIFAPDDAFSVLHTQCQWLCLPQLHSHEGLAFPLLLRVEMDGFSSY